jgi:hypothetical protein
MGPQNSIGAPQRITLIDFLRGFCLAVMTVNHLPSSPFRPFTFQPFGFVSAAEGFVFLSGIVTGTVYGRTAMSQGIRRASVRVYRRLLTIYVTNLVFITFAFIAAKRGIASLGDGFRPDLALWEKSLALVIAPSYAEILRLYCVLFIFVPVVLWALMRNRTRLVVLVSVGLWFVSWCGYGMTTITNSGYFDLLSWQLLFVIGICLGFHRNIMPQTAKWLPALTAACVAIAVGFFVVRHGRLMIMPYKTSYTLWLYSWRRTLAIGRLLDFAAVSFLVYRFRAPLEFVVLSLPGRALTYLGKHSLPVFVWSSTASVLAAEQAAKLMKVSPVERAVFGISVVGSCFVVAWLHSEWQQIRRGGSVPPKRSPMSAHKKHVLSHTA